MLHENCDPLPAMTEDVDNGPSPAPSAGAAASAAAAVVDVDGESSVVVFVWNPCCQDVFFSRCLCAVIWLPSLPSPFGHQTFAPPHASGRVAPVWSFDVDGSFVSSGARRNSPLPQTRPPHGLSNAI